MKSIITRKRMNLFKSESDRYTEEHLSAREAQRLAEYIAWGPVIFQVSRLMVKFGILETLRDSMDGLTLQEIQQKVKSDSLQGEQHAASLQGEQQGASLPGMQLSEYALKILLEASLSAGTVLIDKATDKYTLSKTGWFLLNDPATRVNIDFNHDVNYRGMFYLEEALKEGKPVGLKTLGDWPTIYEGLSKLEPQIQKSWFDFDHFYSDHSFDKALEIVFGMNASSSSSSEKKASSSSSSEKKASSASGSSDKDAGSVKPKHLMDVGGNTGRFALRCVDYDKDVNVTIVDLPGQIGMMQKNIDGKKGADRISGFATNILDTNNLLPKVSDVQAPATSAALASDEGWDAIWMSQFLDCFSEDEIYSILARAAQVMGKDTTLYIMETFWDRQKYEPASLCLTMTSVYFTTMANGNSKMYHSDDLIKQVNRAGLEVVKVYDGIGQGHTILEVKLKA